LSQRLSSVKNLLGERFGYLTVTKYTSERLHGSVVWECTCDCGTFIKATRNNLKALDVKSCGCKSLEMMSPETHGMTDTPTYNTWISMKARCLKPDYSEYHLYGGRGITVCTRWVNSFEDFLEDMGERPKGMTLDRINPDGNYEKLNCHWADASYQSFNQRVSKRNTSGVAGVRWDEKLQSWRVRICKENKLLFNKQIKDFNEAVKIRQELEVKYYGKIKQ
jgi:hypothetical protein